MDKQQILDLMRNKVYKPLTALELADTMEVEPEQAETLGELLVEMEQAGQIIRTRYGRLGVPERMNLVVGRLQAHAKGFGFVISDIAGEPDLYIPLSDMNGAMNNDRVIARKQDVRTGTRQEGAIIRILDRANKQLVGVVDYSGPVCMVIPDDTRISQEIFVPSAGAGAFPEGEKVVVEITRWPEGRRHPEGNIIERLGPAGQTETEIKAIMRKNGLVEDFPADVLAEAEAIPTTIPPEEIARRLDLREMRIVTIDGADAKDLDDAISVELLDNGYTRLGVHIADVTHYVREGSPLNREALERGTSVYLVDRVIPMLPRKLSNGVCSLNPNEDKLTLSVFMEIDPDGRVIRHSIHESVIRTTARMTYTDVSKILLTNDPELSTKYAELLVDFKLMEQLALKLRSLRMKRGALDFDFPEAKVKLNEQGEVTEVYRVERTIADQIIEEFMILCNEVVAEHCENARLPFIYRIHEEPDAERIMSLSQFLGPLGLSVKGVANGVKPKALQALLTQVAGRREERVIQSLILRSLKQARYSNESTFHFGLASRYYSHFTSPIRRYPDLMIHRIIRGLVLSKQPRMQDAARWEKTVGEIANQSSERERRAAEAERDSVDLKKVEYMERHLSEEFRGVISGVTSFGIFVELENTIEGLVHVSSMDDDFYQFNEQTHSLVGERTRKVLRMGDPVTVLVVKVSREARQIDFALIESPNERLPRPTNRKDGKHETRPAKSEKSKLGARRTLVKAGK